MVPLGRTLADAEIGPAPMRVSKETNRKNDVRGRIASPLLSTWLAHDMLGSPSKTRVSRARETATHSEQGRRSHSGSKGVPTLRPRISAADRTAFPSHG